MLIMVGDRASDRAAARENGVPFIGCAFGHAGDEEIAGERWIAPPVFRIPGSSGKSRGTAMDRIFGQ
jgi:phosphoglycolate phosphatase-like HAD superfamily hydrolase